MLGGRGENIVVSDASYQVPGSGWFPRSSILGPLVTAFVIDVLTSGVIPADLNHAFLALILKCKNQPLLQSLGRSAYAMSCIR